MSQSGVRRALPVLAALALFAVSIGLSACSKKAGVLDLGPNTRPTLELTQAPVTATQPFFYGYELRWAGFDTDGRIDHFRYAIDPPTATDAETVWVKTTDNRKSFLFRSDDLDTLTDQTAQGYHTIVLEAVDDRGDFSAPKAVSLTSFTIAPTVQITNPVPNHLFSPTFGPSFRLGWTGSDPDGRGTNKPVKYKYKLFPEGGAEFDFLTVLVNPDSLRRRYAPNFSEWDSVGGDTTAIDLRNLIPNRRYVVAVVAFDEVGAYSPIMNLDQNMLFFSVSFAGLLGPKLTVFNESFFFTYATGGFSLDPASFIRTEAAAGVPLRFNWFATTTSGSFVSGYRWMLDGNVGDETPRTDEATETQRWSRYSPLVTGIDLPPINPSGVSETHFLYIEAVDNNQQVSLAVVQFTVVKALLDRDLLLVDDTRLLPDRRVAGAIDRPRGVWPTAAELDTFFFARGGRPWASYPTGTLSPVGVFQGYDYDTLGTRFLPLGLISLQTLGRYRHVVWYTDNKASLNVNEITSTQDPMSELRFVSNPSRSNPLGTYVQQGGQLWFFGGGTASALQRNWEKSGTAADVYSNADGELVAGRLMYDVFGWRSEIVAKSMAQATKPLHDISRNGNLPSTAELPDYLFEKSPDTDPISVYAPNRVGTSDFYQSAHGSEGVSKPNEVVFDADPDPNTVRLESVLDTLYESVGGQMGSGRAVMTVMHAPDGKLHVFSGFQLWYWRREQQIAILDWVLQKVWGLPRRNVPR
ncbi:MAG: hypothetical protein K8R56_04085 [Candidatus Eisenbacteria bacterium]|nr:hypothetical protein [Candidatus Eisenbacteria bacterium]